MVQARRTGIFSLFDSQSNRPELLIRWLECRVHGPAGCMPSVPENKQSACAQEIPETREKFFRKYHLSGSLHFVANSLWQWHQQGNEKMPVRCQRGVLLARFCLSFLVGKEQPV
jgi:hypothetical protein